MLPNLVLSPAHDWVVVVGVRSLKVDFATLAQELTHLTEEANHWVGGSASS